MDIPNSLVGKDAVFTPIMTTQRAVAYSEQVVSVGVECGIDDMHVFKNLSYVLLKNIIIVLVSSRLEF